MRFLIVAFWRGGFPLLPPIIGLAVIPVSIGKPRASAHRRSNSCVFPRVLPRWASGRERLSGNPSCAGATALRQRATGVAGSLGKSPSSDLAYMGKRRRHREEGRAQDEG